ncbi:PaaI family thioesterase [Blastococcus saxobsidens]|uniref:Medium/long-chain acyl-CoA thioesterase YigI n=1 Tax=Blastococcus saxobsidens (strain DD2) TaxID=1146883 RepID=H6RRP1_BLASD|nr:PaaI family thioesterase [Blastococcus saxobsidens]CCG01684.1 putative phenylacetic acid degradation protein [Blastococcus saxobsidens DD2]
MGDETADLARAQRVLAEQPFSVLLGTRITECGDGSATLEIDVREELCQQHGFLHGGVVSYAADNALTFAAGSVSAGGVLTAGFSIDYVRPAVGTILRAHARVINAGRSRIICRCDLSTVDHDGAERLCAVTQGAISVVETPTR